MAKFEPMLSAKIFSTKEALYQKNLGLLKFPYDASTKWDGFRLVDYEGQMHMRSLKVVRNHHIRATTTDFLQCARGMGYFGFDGEVAVGDIRSPNLMQQCSSGVQSFGGTPDFTYLLFDSYQHAEKEHTERQKYLEEAFHKLNPLYPWLTWVPQTRVDSMEGMLLFEAEELALGGEGIMLKRRDGKYKFGRATMLSQELMALKRFVDKDCIVVEILEEMENTNPLEENELGRSKRSSHKENLVPKGRMGTMRCLSLEFDKPFNVGSGHGVDFNFREEVWRNPLKYLMQPMKFTHQEIGVKDRPRLSKFAAWRPVEDMDPEVWAALLEKAKSYVPVGGPHSITAACYA